MVRVLMQLFSSKTYTLYGNTPSDLSVLCIWIAERASSSAALGLTYGEISREGAVSASFSSSFEELPSRLLPSRRDEAARKPNEKG